MLAEAQAFIHNNPFIAGAGGVAGFGFLFNYLRAIPGRLWDFLYRQFTVELTVLSEDEFFDKFNTWVSALESAKRTRKLSIAETWDRIRQKERYSLAPGPGRHFLWYKGRPLYLHRSVKEAGAGNDGPSFSSRGKRMQELTLTMFGRSRSAMMKLVEEATSEERKDSVAVHVWNHSYQLIEHRPKRSLDTVYLANHVKEEIVADLQAFFDNKDVYHRRGIPWRRGYFFYGPPGTGKTTLIFALASYFEKPVYIINCGNITSDGDLQEAINSGRDGFVIIEDIDSMNVTLSREKNDGISRKDRIDLTQSGLLNAIDGLSAVDGRVLFITSNKPEILDQALLRDGRVDIAKNLDLAGETEAYAMFKVLCPDDSDDLFRNKVVPLLPLSQAALQGLMLKDLHNADNLA